MDSNPTQPVAPIASTDAQTPVTTQQQPQQSSLLPETPLTRAKLAGAIHQLQAKGDTNSINQLVAAYKQKYQTAPSTPKLGQGAAGDFAGNAVRAVASPLIRTGGAIENVLGSILSMIPGVKVSPQAKGEGAQQTANALDQGAAQNIPGKIGTVVGTVAPYFAGMGPEEVAANYASMLPKIADTLGIDASKLAPKVAAYLGSRAPNIAVGTGIGTAQTGNLQQGATIGAGGQIASDVIAPAARLLAKGVGKAGSQVLGASTGSGASSVEAGYQAGRTGSSAFTDAMRGKTNPDAIVNNVQDAVQTIANNRRSQYLSALGNIKGQPASIDISPVADTLSTQLKNFGVKVTPDGTLDFSRSSIANNGSARADIQGVFDTLKNWGTQKGDRTAVGLDTLKKQLADFYSQSGSARAFVQAVKSKVSDILNKEVPGYGAMTSDYAKATQLLSDIKSATGVGGKSSVDTVFTKLTSAMRGDKQMRLEVIREMTNAANTPDLEAKIAGINMQSLIPKGLVGRGADMAAIFGALSHVFNPQFIPTILATSPRLMGEFVNSLGVGARYAEPLTNFLTKVVSNPAIVQGVTAQLNKKQ
jgi:hypothetical protein